MTELTPDYFIAKFSAIPDKDWCVGSLTRARGPGHTEQHCALGHLGFRSGIQNNALPGAHAEGVGEMLIKALNGSQDKFTRTHRIHSPTSAVVTVNDSRAVNLPPDIRADHPKCRIINALRRYKTLTENET